MSSYCYSFIFNAPFFHWLLQDFLFILGGFSSLTMLSLNTYIYPVWNLLHFWACASLFFIRFRKFLANTFSKKFRAAVSLFLLRYQWYVLRIFDIVSWIPHSVFRFFSIFFLVFSLDNFYLSDFKFIMPFQGFF